MDDILYKLIANPNRLKKKDVNSNNIYNTELLRVLKLKYNQYEITDDMYNKIKKQIDDIVINDEINLIVNEMIELITPSTPSTPSNE
jgi:hypothetical protein